jgi:hypothetical protein
LPRRRPGVPDRDEEVLLRVCFLPAEQAGRLWDEHGAGVEVEALAPEAHGLLPLLHRRLLELDRRPPVLDKLAGVRRRLWVQNELRLRSTVAALETLGTAGIPSALVGGVAVLAGHLGSLDLRPLHDVEILVPAPDAGAAVQALAGSGWEPGAQWRNGYLLDLGARRLTDAEGRSVVLRWSSEPPYPESIERRWFAEAASTSVPVVDPADLLVHVLVDGSRALRRASVRWASDALAVLTYGPAVDRGRLVEGARARRAGPTVRSALDRLDRLVPIELEATSTAMLAAGRRPWWERLLGADAAGPTTAVRAAVRRSSGAAPWPVAASVLQVVAGRVTGRNQRAEMQ